MRAIIGLGRGPLVRQGGVPAMSRGKRVRQVMDYDHEQCITLHKLAAALGYLPNAVLRLRVTRLSVSVPRLRAVAGLALSQMSRRVVIPAMARGRRESL